MPRKRPRIAFLRGERVTLYPDVPDAPTGAHEPVVVMGRTGGGRYLVKRATGAGITVPAHRLARQGELPL